MCVEIRYVFAHCGCAYRIGHYTCYHAKHIAKTGFSLGCDRYKKTEQEMRTGKIVCNEHLALLERPLVREQERTSEETTDRDGEGESLMGIDLDGGVNREGRGEARIDGEFDALAGTDRDGEDGVKVGATA
jgi:hypothetical protein